MLRANVALFLALLVMNGNLAYETDLLACVCPNTTLISPGEFCFQWICRRDQRERRLLLFGSTRNLHRNGC